MELTGVPCYVATIPSCVAVGTGLALRIWNPARYLEEP